MLGFVTPAMKAVIASTGITSMSVAQVVVGGTPTEFGPNQYLEYGMVGVNIAFLAFLLKKFFGDKPSLVTREYGILLAEALIPKVVEEATEQLLASTKESMAEAVEASVNAAVTRAMREHESDQERRKD